MKAIVFENVDRESQAEITEWMIDNNIKTQTVTADDPQPIYWAVSDEDAEKIKEQFPYADLIYLPYITTMSEDGKVVNASFEK